MKVKVITILAFLLLSLGSASAQTTSDLAAKYGEPVRAYVISEHIWMTPDYSADGQVCQMRLYPRRIGAANDNYLSKRLPFDEIKFALNQLVPVNKRGNKKDSFGLTTTGGGAVWTTYPYEKVTFVFIFPLRLDPTTSGFRPYVFSEKAVEASKEKVGVDRTPNENDFINSESFNTEIVTITWTNRTCSGQ